MTLAGLVVKTIASAALNEMATDQVGEYKIVNNARAGRSKRCTTVLHHTHTCLPD